MFYHKFFRKFFLKTWNNRRLIKVILGEFWREVHVCGSCDFVIDDRNCLIRIDRGN